MNTYKEKFMELIGFRDELIPLIHNALAMSYISVDAYAQVFKTVFYTMTESSNATIAYCKGTGDWRLGKKTISDIKLICLLDRVCDIIRYYVLSSWDDCIFSAWCSDKEVIKVCREIDAMETMDRMSEILKLAAETMVYNSDGAIVWSSESSDKDSDGKGDN